MNIRPVSRINISDQIAEQIKNMIIDGTLKGGDQIPTEQELARNFNVSRASVREALKALESMGLLNRSREGTFVCDSDINMLSDPLIYKIALKGVELGDLIEVRKLLEIPSAGLAAEYATEEDLVKIENSVYDLDMLIKNPDRVNYSKELQEGIDFHTAVALASQNVILYEIITALRHLQILSNLEVLRSPGILSRTYQYHKNIFYAIKDRNAELAQQIMLEHINDVGDQLKKLGVFDLLTTTKGTS